MQSENSFTLFAGSSHPGLAQQVADELSRPLSSWEIFQGKPSIVALDVELEMALRLKLTASRDIVGVTEGIDRSSFATIPLGPPESRTPTEIFASWLSSQLAEMREKMQETQEKSTL